MKVFYPILLLSAVLIGTFQATGQVLNPDDVNTKYNASSPPTTPPYDSIGKWVYTPSMGYSTAPYKCYYYKGMAFRLMFPKSWTPGTTQKYPMVIFLHGLGERGTIYDNELSLKWEGKNFIDAQNSGKYDGFVMFPQSQNGFWGEPYYKEITEIIDYMVKNVKLDINRVHLSGLSAGGSGDWAFLTSYPKYFASAQIISAAYNDLLNYINNPLKYIPIWLSQGELDGNPAPYTSQQIVNALMNVGADITYTVYANAGHGVWDYHYAEPDTYPYYNRKNKVNPVLFFGKSEFCPSDTNNINVTLGLTPGFQSYQWREGSTIIPGATGNTLTVHTLGTYSARVMRNGEWSYWSPAPVVIKVKPPTQTPDIQVKGLMSSVIPAPDGNTTVTLTLPSGYATYQWQKVGNPTVLSTQKDFVASSPGSYVAKVTESDGCSANFSAPFYVASTSGSNPPDPATNPSGFAISQTEIQLNWSNNPTPVYNETAFEVYRSQSKGGPYQLVGVSPSDSLSFIDNNLVANTKYYYIIRAIDSTAAAAVSEEIAVTTQVDNQPPTAPILTVEGTTRTSVSLSWTASTDNASVSKYFIYVNGAKSFITTDTAFTVNNLTQGQLYRFYVKALDPTGNYSTASNQVTAPTIFTGLNYDYYTFTGNWSKLPNFNTLTPVKSGTTNNVNIDLRTQEDNFAFKWTGYIKIPKTGSYTFSTNSDDGSRLYVNKAYSYNTTPLVDNDGLHGTTLKSGTIQLSAGTYPITATFFEQGGGQVMEVYWQSTALNNGNARTKIPDSAFTDQFTMPGVPPEKPSGIHAVPASFNQINLTWNDNSTNESGFEIYRATQLSGPYSIIATTGANVVSYHDSTCSPATTYYYKIQAINQYGSSGFNLADLGGVTYNYYSVSSSLTKLPNFNTMTPVKSGSLENISLDPRLSNTNFAFKFSGTIEIPTSGQYTFYTRSDDNSKLYIGGFSESNLVVNNDYLQGATERSGTINLSAGSYPIYVTYMQIGGGYELSASYKGPGISKVAIPSSAFSNANMKATTLPPPAIPLAPTNLSAVGLSASKIRIHWSANLGSVSKFTVFRSVGNNSAYQFLRDVPVTGSDTVSVVDSALFSNTTYFYKVVAKNGLDSSSQYSNEASAVTSNNLPVIDHIGDHTIRYGTSFAIDIIASDPDGEHLTLSVSNKPSFASFQDYGDGSGLITFSPGSTDIGTYSNIIISVHDQHGGISNQDFTITVNDNYPPVINPVGGLTLNAGEVLKDTITANDLNPGDVITWGAAGLPSFATFSQISNDKAVITLSPAFENAGDYSITINVNDGKGGVDSKIIPVHVNFVDPNKKWYINFKYQTSASSPWNNVVSLSSTNFSDDQGHSTSVGLNFQTSWWATYDGGSVTGNNSGVYPDNVIKDYYYFGIFGGPDTVLANVVGLEPGKSYDLTFYAGSSWNGVADNGHTVFSSQGQVGSIDVQGNSTVTLTLHSLVANASGVISFVMKKGADAPVGYLNALVISSQYESQLPPSAPSDFQIGLSGNDGVLLKWVLPLLNTADEIQVFRSKSLSGPFSQINGGTSNGSETQFLDATVMGNTTYYYCIRALNENGASQYSDTLAITTLVKDPKIDPIEDVIIKYGNTKSIAVNASADLTDVVTLSSLGLPVFASFTDNGGGHGTISINPQSTDVGTYSGIKIVASTDHGGRDTVSFDIAVTNKNIRQINVDFLSNGSVSTGVWNAIGGWAFAGTTLANLKDANNVATTVGISLLDSWSNSYNYGGHNTYSNTGIVPDQVLTSFYVQNDNNTRRVQLNGLKPFGRYNLLFASSSVVGDGPVPNYTTTFSVGSMSTSINGYRNTQSFAQLNGVWADQNGQIVINVKKGSSANSAVLNAMIIEDLEDTTIIQQPTALKATSDSKTQVKLAWIDHAYNETGYRIFRSTSKNGSYIKIDSVGANVSSYVDNSVVPNKKYFYKVQAKTNGGSSDYSNIAAVTTPQYLIYMNFNYREAAAPAPWNNANKAPIDGDTFENLLSDQGISTGVTLKFIKNYENENNVGVITGNNSGIFPDLVMNGIYYLDNGLDTVVAQLSGLDISKKYDFSFFGSLVGFGWNNTTLFLINGKQIGLNVANNSMQTVALNDILPDENGIITIKMINADHCAYAIFGAMVIKCSSNYDDDGNQVINEQQMRLALHALDNELSYKDAQSNIDSLNSRLLVQVLPNPFKDAIYIRLHNLPGDGNTMISLVDMNGRSVYKYNAGRLAPGVNSLTLNLSGANIGDQLYILKVQTSQSNRVQTVKLIHRR